MEDFSINNLSQNFPKYLHDFFRFRAFAVNFETILVKLCFGICSASEFIKQDGTMLPDYEKAGQD